MLISFSGYCLPHVEMVRQKSGTMSSPTPSIDSLNGALAFCDSSGTNNELTTKKTKKAGQEREAMSADRLKDLTSAVAITFTRARLRKLF